MTELQTALLGTEQDRALLPPEQSAALSYVGGDYRRKAVYVDFKEGTEAEDREKTIEFLREWPEVEEVTANRAPEEGRP